MIWQTLLNHVADIFRSLSGADIIGVNCKFDPTTSMEALRLMKEALDKEGHNPYLMIQPVGYHTPDAGRVGFASLPEIPFGVNLFHCVLVVCIMTKRAS